MEELEKENERIKQEIEQREAEKMEPSFMKWVDGLNKSQLIEFGDYFNGSKWMGPLHSENLREYFKLNIYKH
jgi:hypothetical protein